LDSDDLPSFAAGIMMSSSFWSLLNPALELSKQSEMFGRTPYIPVSIGFLFGCYFVHLSDLLLNEYKFEELTGDIGFEKEDKLKKFEMSRQWKRTLLM
jgi:zinc transporter ZupT